MSAKRYSPEEKKADEHTKSRQADDKNKKNKSSKDTGFSIENCPEIRGHWTDFVACGEGSYGSVYKAKDVRTGHIVAIKRVRDMFANDITAKRILREVRILRLLKQQNVINFRGLLRPENVHTFNDLFMVFDFFDTDIGRIIGSDQFITNFHVQCFMYQLLMAIKYVHSQHIIHRDLKPSNLLVNADCSLVVCDFGLARMQPELNVGPMSPLKPLTRFPRHQASCARALDFSPPLPAASAPVPIPAPRAPPPGSPITALSSMASLSSSLTSISPANLPPSFGSSSSPLPPPPAGLMARTMTQHVVTRWYRAPEINLSAEYTSAIDMWSVGCIFAEFLGMQKESFATHSDRQILFPGTYSAFLSPVDEDKGVPEDAKKDQLNIIFNVIGTPEPEELKRVCTNPNPATQKYLATLLAEAADTKTRRPPKDLRALYRGADPQAIDLLTKLLKFDPSKRLTAQQALEHPYFARIREDAVITERYGRHDIVYPAHTSAVCHANDFSFEDDQDLGPAKLRKLIASEIALYPEL